MTKLDEMMYQAFYKGKPYGKPVKWNAMITLRKTVDNLRFKAV